MTRMRPAVVASLLVLAGLPVRAGAAEDPPAQPAEQKPPPSTVKAKVARELETPAKPEVPCETSTECAEKVHYGEVCHEKKCRPYEDGTDLFTILKMSQPGRVVPAPFVLYPAIVPAIGYNPALGFLIGVTAFFGMYLGDPDNTTISNEQPVFLITSEKQIVLQLVGTLMTSANEWELQNDYRFLIYNQDTYGLGTGIPPVGGGFNIGGYGQTEAVPGAQPMKWDLLRFHQAVLKKVTGPLYLGGALRFDRYYNIVDESLNLTGSPPTLTSHYAYSKYYGFNSNQYNIVSLGLEALYDSRDSTINPYRGIYANFVLRGNPTWLGSTKNSSQVYGEFRTYIGLDDDIPRNVLAFWVLAQGVMSGELPYLALPAIGWDTRGRTGRGWVAGHWRGSAEVYLESELRFRLTDNGFLGGVVFANAVTFARPAVTIPGYSNPGVHLFQYIAPAGGFGLRFMMNRASRTNITFDFAFSATGMGIYLGAGEAF